MPVLKLRTWDLKLRIWNLVSPPQRPHHSRVSPPERHEMAKFVLNFCYCAVHQERTVFKRTPQRASPPQRGHSGVSPPQRGLPTTARSPHHSGVSPPQWGLPPRGLPHSHHSGSPHTHGAPHHSRVYQGLPKFVANFCYCAVDQEKAVFKRKRAVSGPCALFGHLGSHQGLPSTVRSPRPSALLDPYRVLIRVSPPQPLRTPLRT